jgi:NADH:ubiquinone oxidoreductase subunit H
MTSAVVPFGDTVTIGGVTFDLQGIDVNIGILWVFGIVSLGVYGILIGGWASNNKYSLLGAIRAASQNISYELAMGLAIIAILLLLIVILSSISATSGSSLLSFAAAIATSSLLLAILISLSVCI